VEGECAVPQAESGQGTSRMLDIGRFVVVVGGKFLRSRRRRRSKDLQKWPERPIPSFIVDNVFPACENPIQRFARGNVEVGMEVARCLCAGLCRGNVPMSALVQRSAKCPQNGIKYTPFFMCTSPHDIDGFKLDISRISSSSSSSSWR
jgi:hypothetical protein